MRRLIAAAMLGLGLWSGAASAAPVEPGVVRAEDALLIPVQYRHYGPPRHYQRRYYAPPPRRYYRHHLPPRARHAPPPRRYYR